MPASSGVTKPKTPPVMVMALAAIEALNERSGSSMRAIIKYMVATYECDSDHIRPFVKRFLVKSVVDGQLIQKKGQGANGSFKLAKKKVSPSKKPKTKQPKTENTEVPKTAKASAPKKLKTLDGEQPTKKPKLSADASSGKKRLSMTKTTATVIPKKASGKQKKASTGKKVTKLAVVSEIDPLHISTGEALLSPKKTPTKGKSTKKTGPIQPKTPKPKRTKIATAVAKVARAKKTAVTPLD